VRSMQHRFEKKDADQDQGIDPWGQRRHAGRLVGASGLEGDLGSCPGRARVGLQAYGIRSPQKPLVIPPAIDCVNCVTELTGDLGCPKVVEDSLRGAIREEIHLRTADEGDWGNVPSLCAAIPTQQRAGDQQG
jgi:hypothetical protein